MQFWTCAHVCMLIFRHHDCNWPVRSWTWKMNIFPTFSKDTSYSFAIFSFVRSLFILFFEFGLHSHSPLFDFGGFLFFLSLWSISITCSFTDITIGPMYACRHRSKHGSRKLLLSKLLNGNGCVKSPSMISDDKHIHSYSHNLHLQRILILNVVYIHWEFVFFFREFTWCGSAYV